MSTYYFLHFFYFLICLEVKVCWACATYVRRTRRMLLMQHAHAKQNTSRSIKTSLNHYFSGVFEGKFELDRIHMANAAQTQPNICDVRGMQFYAESSLAPKRDRVKTKYSVWSLTRTQIKRRQKGLCFKNGNVR